MFDIITAISTNLFRTFIIKKFVSVFFKSEVEDRREMYLEKNIYLLFFLITTGVYLIFHSPSMNLITNLTMIYMITRMYKGEQKKKILVSVLVYGINMVCDVLSIYSFSNYIFGEDYERISAYITVLLISICEFYIEKYTMKKGRADFIPPHWNILILIPVVSVIILFGLVVNNLNNQALLVLVSAGILLIDVLIFYLYDALLGAYLKLEENAAYESQAISYANQLDVLMQSEEKISALRHDMKHHLNELIIMATGKQSKQDIVDYIHNMEMFIENKKEYSYSGNKEIDSILNFLLNQAQEVLNQVEYRVVISKDIKLPFFDLNIIFGNLLENAIEAASNSSKKWMYVLVQYDKGMLLINVQNSYEDKLKKDKGFYETTKGDGLKHGIGLQNVKRVVNKYNGSINILDENEIFDVKVVLYVASEISLY